MTEEKLTEQEVKAIVEEEERNGCEYGTYCNGEDKIFYPKEDKRDGTKKYQREEAKKAN